MANWVDIATTAYNGATGGYNLGLKATMQYDADSVTPTSVKLRFKASTTSNGNDGYYVLWRPGVSGERLLKLKSAGGSVTSSSSFTLTKDTTAKKYTIPNYWICHCGSETPTGLDKTETANHTIKYSSNGTRTVYWYFTNSRQNYKTMVPASEFNVSAVSNAYATEVTPGSTYLITDNGDHTFTLWGYAGKGGANNDITEERLWYAVTTTSSGSWAWGNNWSRFPKGAATHSLTIALPKATISSIKNKNDKVDIVSCVETFASYGDSKNGIDGTYKYGDMKVYARPTQPGRPVISYKKSRLTIKEDWTYTWTPATAGNDNSPVNGYRVRIYKNGTGITGLKATPVFGNAGTVKEHRIELDGSNTTNYMDIVPSSDCKIRFNPKTLGFKADDTVCISLFSYAKNGLGQTKWTNTLTGGGTESYSLFCGNDTDGDKPVYSDIKTVQNAGIIRIKVNGAWKEGQVHVKVNGAWKEADIVHTKVNGVWKESE